MLPQYAQRDRGAEVALWLLITVGALLIPIIAITICCIRRHLGRRPCIKLMELQRTMINTKQVEALRSYNGPYNDSGNDDAGTLSRTNSLKKQHVHWPDGSINTTKLAESPSAHRRPYIIPSTSTPLSHFIQTAIIPASSTVGSIGVIPSKEFTSISAEHNSIM